MENSKFVCIKLFSTTHCSTLIVAQEKASPECWKFQKHAYADFCYRSEWSSCRVGQLCHLYVNNAQKFRIEKRLYMTVDPVHRKPNQSLPGLVMTILDITGHKSFPEVLLSCISEFGVEGINVNSLAMDWGVFTGASQIQSKKELNESN